MLARSRTESAEAAISVANVRDEMSRRGSCSTIQACKLELVGRSPLPTDAEDAELAAAPDAMAIRRLLVGRGRRDPGEIEAERPVEPYPGGERPAEEERR